MPANHHAADDLTDQPTDIPQVGLAIITGSANWGLPSRKMSKSTACVPCGAT